MWSVPAACWKRARRICQAVYARAAGGEDSRGRQSRRRRDDSVSALKRTVLVVDDEESIRELFPALLGGTHRVLLAADGKEAVDIVRREPQIDLVLTDLFMPNQDGIEMIDALQELRPALRIIAMSGAFDGEFLSAAERAGVDATLRKPIELDTLRRTVDEVPEPGAASRLIRRPVSGAVSWCRKSGHPAALRLPFEPSSLEKARGFAGPRIALDR